MLMTQNENAQIASSDQMLELASSLIKNLPTGMSVDIVVGWNANPKALARMLRSGLLPPEFDTSDKTQRLLEEWRMLYRELLDIELGEVVVPARRPGFDRLIVVAKGVKMQQVYDACANLFKCWKYTDKDLDEVITVNDRTNQQSYAIWIRNEVEADKQFKNKSANDLKAVNHIGMTVLERILFELKYFKETGKHLDIDSWTLCSGSRYSDGHVPNVNWSSYDSKMNVDYDGPDLRDDGLRSREVVS
jgi:hypothetical protein